MGKKARREELAVFLWLKYRITWTNYVYVTLALFQNIESNNGFDWVSIAQDTQKMALSFNCVEQQHQYTAFILRSWLVWIEANRCRVRNMFLFL